MWCRVTMPKLSVSVHAVHVQIYLSWGSALLCVGLGWCEWETLSKPWDAERPIVPSLAFFRTRRAWPTRCLCMTIFLWEPEVLNQERSALWEPASRDFTLPSNPCVPGLGFYQILFVIPLDFSNKQWNANMWPEGKTSQLLKGKRTWYPNDSWLCGWSNDSVS